jgi:hypothetical protein
MSKCPPVDVKVNMPAFQPYIEGVYGKTPWSGRSIASTSGDKNVILIFNKFCNGSNTYYEKQGGKTVDEDKGGFISISQVYCRPAKNQAEWSKLWDQVKGQAKVGNPHNFLTSPIDWIRYEVTNLVTNAMHWWLEVDDPFSGDYGKGGDSDSTGVYDTIIQNTLFISAVIAVIALLVVAGRMALERNARPAADAARSLFTLVVVVAAGLTVLKLLLKAGDRFSRAFIVRGLGAPENAVNAHCAAMEDRLKTLPKNFEDMNFFLFLMCALFLIVASIVLYVSMVGRVFVVTLLAGLLPLSAAGTATESGRAWFGRQVAHLMAFVLVKPAATIVLVVALRMSKLPEGGGSGAQQLAASIMLFLGTVMLPAMTRLAFPFTSPAARGEKASQAMLAGTAAVGAKAVKGGMNVLRR